MKNLLYKEFRLALHQTCFIFLALSAMLLIPSYPYYVVFFYTTLGIFFTCLLGRENNDITYMLLLPLRKRDAVRARIGMAVALELLQIVACVPFILIRNGMGTPNDAGMDANLALIGLSLIMLGVFNLVFFPRYYKDVSKVGTSFIVASVVTFLYLGAAEVAAHVVPFFRDVLDTPDPLHMGAKLITLGCGVALFSLLTLWAYRLSVSAFEKVDL